MPTIFAPAPRSTRADVDRAELADRIARLTPDDPAYFSRENKRHFGEPPMRDVERLRGGATAM